MRAQRQALEARAQVTSMHEAVTMGRKDLQDRIDALEAEGRIRMNENGRVRRARMWWQLALASRSGCGVRQHLELLVNACPHYCALKHSLCSWAPRGRR